jgi:hypothetical protein
MAKSKRRSVKKSKPKVSLGFPPDEHRKRAKDYELDAVRFLRDVENEADAGRCPIAFDRLIDGVSYAGMAEAEAQGSGSVSDVAPLQSLAASAIRYYRKNCMGVK